MIKLMLADALRILQTDGNMSDIGRKAPKGPLESLLGAQLNLFYIERLNSLIKPFKDKSFA